LDPNVTVIEQVPLVIQQRRELPLKRVGRVVVPNEGNG
jgi:hypothetical protein